MTTIERSIRDTLIELEDAVRGVAKSHPKPDFIALFERIDQLTDQLPKETDPALLHYLRKKSYEKARLWLDGRDAENATGNCRHD